MSRYLSTKYAGLNAYVPGEQPQDMQYIKLNTNEFPYPPSPAVLAAITENDIARLRLYSDPACTKLRRALAETYGVGEENVLPSNGSDDALNYIFMAFAGAGVPAFFPDISYGFYSVFAQLHGIDYTAVPLREDFSVCADDYLGKNGLIVIANPNAPTGLTMPRSEVEWIVQSNTNNVVVIDEAYVDFGGESCVELTKKYDNVLVVMTFSKSRGLAGGRLGFTIGCRELIADLEKLKYSTNPYNVNALTQLVGVAALESADYYKARCAEIIETRQNTAAALEKMGFEVIPSSTNFVFARKDGFDGAYLYTELKRRGILVRHFAGARTAPFIRITIGTPEEMARFTAGIRDIIGGSEA